MKHFLFIISMLTAVSAFCQLNEVERDQFDFLMGSWSGTGEGIPGKSKGDFSFKQGLDKNVIIRNTRSEILGKDDKPTAVHEDLMIIYKQSPSDPTAIYFDNEGHTIHYKISYTDSSITFLSDTVQVIPGTPQFRLTYVKQGKKNIRILFEFAMPDKPKDFITYVVGNAMKTKED